MIFLYYKKKVCIAFKINCMCVHVYGFERGWMRYVLVIEPVYCEPNEKLIQLFH